MIDLYRKIALTEAVSYLILLLIAMPFKYLFDFPHLVKYVGWAHGILFIAYIALLLLCWTRYNWSVLRGTGFFLASLVPFAPFVVEKKLKKEYADE